MTSKGIVWLAALCMMCSGCVMLKTEEWEGMQAELASLRKSSQELKDSDNQFSLKLQELEKRLNDDLSSQIASLEKRSGESVREIRERQADISADITLIRSEFQVLTGRFEEIKYSIQKDIQEGRLTKDEVTSREKDNIRRLEELDKRLAAMEQSLTALSQQQIPAPDKTTPPNQEELYKSAYDTYQDGEIALAKDKFLNFIELYPDSKLAENAKYWIGECYYSEMNFERAIVEFDDVIKKYPHGTKAPAAMLKQGMSFLALKDKKSANAIFQLLIEKYPKSEQADAAKKRLKGQ